MRYLHDETSDGHFAEYACRDNVVFINNRSWS